MRGTHRRWLALIAGLALAASIGGTALGAGGAHTALWAGKADCGDPDYRGEYQRTGSATFTWVGTGQLSVSYSLRNGPANTTLYAALYENDGGACYRPVQQQFSTNERGRGSGTFTWTTNAASFFLYIEYIGGSGIAETLTVSP
ncbi:MAG: hypothetical protein ACAH65_10115 [Chloroflexota bacterium]